MEKPYVIDSLVFEDHRGSFTPLNLSLLGKDWLQSNVSVNKVKNTFRGLHYQNGEHAQAKLVKVIYGKIIDFVVDLRPDSPDYMKLQEFEIDVTNAILVPRGFAHGFITLEDRTIVQYLVDNDYNKNEEATLFWSEVPELVEKFKDVQLVISDKDNPNLI